MLAVLSVVMVILVLGYLLLRFNTVWIYGLFDRALRNDRSRLSEAYERPRYYTLSQDGNVATSVRWPGWDGWYFFVVPEDRGLPVKMVRASLMTGLYGLNGIDDYEKIPDRLSSFEVVEYLSLIPAEEWIDGRREKKNRLAQHYLPKRTDLVMRPDRLDVAIIGARGETDRDTEPYGRITGAWPHYEFRFMNPQAEIRIDLRYQGEDIVWWADIPGVFTYFAAFGTFDGEVIYRPGASVGEAQDLGQRKENALIKGRGCFEHGCARKPFNVDGLWRPVKWLQKLFPSLRPIRYLYELLIGDDGHHGGFMKASGFGIDFRHHGGLYVNGSYQEIRRIEIEYVDDPAPDRVSAQGQPPVMFYRRWKVRAVTTDGDLEYAGTREWPPAVIASNMIYYNFSYEGSYNGRAISGRGYGEYVHM